MSLTENEIGKASSMPSPKDPGLARSLPSLPRLSRRRLIMSRIHSSGSLRLKIFIPLRVGQKTSFKFQIKSVTCGSKENDKDVLKTETKTFKDAEDELKAEFKAEAKAKARRY
jgi:hypothetical protein